MSAEPNSWTLQRNALSEKSSVARRPPLIFDAAAGIASLLRARRLGPADFLLQRAVEDLDDRLAPIMRDFEMIADIGTPMPLFAMSLLRRYEKATVLRLALHETLIGEGSSTSIVGKADSLPLRRAQFDLIVSGMALHQIDDLPGALIQIRQALKPDGLFLACLPGGDTLKELRDVLAIAESDLTGGLSPRVFPFADIRDLGGLLQRAGFALPVSDSESVVVRYDTPFALMHDLRAMGATNTLNERRRALTRRSIFLSADKLYRERFSDADGRIRATFETLWVSGWAPHESQQKPLKPGSAQKRLADVLAPSSGRGTAADY